MEGKLQEMKFVAVSNGMMATDGETGNLTSYSLWRHIHLGCVLVLQLKSGNVAMYKAYDPEELKEDAREKGVIFQEKEMITQEKGESKDEVEKKVTDSQNDSFSSLP